MYVERRCCSGDAEEEAEERAGVVAPMLLFPDVSRRLLPSLFLPPFSSLYRQLRKRALRKIKHRSYRSMHSSKVARRAADIRFHALPPPPPHLRPERCQQALLSTRSK